MNLLDAVLPPVRDGRTARLATIVVLALLIGIGVNHVVWAVAQWPLGDLHIYLAAAERLQAGEPLYIATDPQNPLPGGGVLATQNYWYAPWFAVAMIPMTWLPVEVVSVLWSALLLACTFAVGVVLWRMGTPASRLLAVLAVPALFAVSAGGNVQAPMVLALLAGLYRRSGPIWVALAASLKFTPILFALVYLARREWAKVAWSVGLTAVLLLPAFVMGMPLDRVQDWDDAAPSILAWGLPVYLAAVGACCVVAVALPRYSALAAAGGAVLALPRLFVYDVTVLAAGAADPDKPVTARVGR